MYIYAVIVSQQCWNINGHVITCLNCCLLDTSYIKINNMIHMYSQCDDKNMVKRCSSCWLKDVHLVYLFSMSGIAWCLLSIFKSLLDANIRYT